MNKNLLKSSAIVMLVYWAVMGMLLYRRHVREAAQEKVMRGVAELDYNKPTPYTAKNQYEAKAPNKK